MPRQLTFAPLVLALALTPVALVGESVDLPAGLPKAHIVSATSVDRLPNGRWRRVERSWSRGRWTTTTAFAYAHVATTTSLDDLVSPFTFGGTASAGETGIFAWNTNNDVDGTSEGTEDGDTLETLIKQAWGGDRQQNVRVVCSLVATGGSVTFSSTNATLFAPNMIYARYTGIATSACVDASASANGSSTTALSGDATATQNVLVWGWFLLGNRDCSSVDNGLTERADSGVAVTDSWRSVVADKSGTSGAVSAQCTLDSSGGWGAMVVALKEASGGATFPAAIINALLRGGGWWLFWPERP